MNKNYNYKKLTPFKWFVLQNFPFIDEDFDAITNYQLFCKLGEEINKLIISMNQAGTQVEELTNYVNNYFDNLDVQDEINNKLDEMAQDGTLQEIISLYLQLNTIYCFNNVEELKNSSNLIDGSFAKTLGYYTPNDGGQGLYKIRNITTQDIIDDGKIIAINNNLIANLISNEINVKQYGAKGDGITDDTIQIQKAINNYDKIIFEDGNFIFTTLNIENNKILTNKGNSILKGNFIKITGNNVTLLNIKFDGQKNSEGIDVTGNNILFDNCEIYNMKKLDGFTRGIDLRNTHHVTIKNCYFHDYESGDETATVGIDKGSVRAIRTWGSQYISIFNNRFDNFSGHKDGDIIVIQQGELGEVDNNFPYNGLKRYNMQDIKIFNNTFIQKDCKSSLKIQTSNVQIFDNLFIVKNETSSMLSVIRIQAGDNNNISNNEFQIEQGTVPFAHILYLGNCANCTINNNNYYVEDSLSVIPNSSQNLFRCASTKNVKYVNNNIVCGDIRYINYWDMNEDLLYKNNTIKVTVNSFPKPTFIRILNTENHISKNIIVENNNYKENLLDENITAQSFLQLEYVENLKMLSNIFEISRFGNITNLSNLSDFYFKYNKIYNKDSSDNIKYLICFNANCQNLDVRYNYYNIPVSFIRCIQAVTNLKFSANANYSGTTIGCIYKYTGNESELHYYDSEFKSYGHDYGYSPDNINYQDGHLFYARNGKLQCYYGGSWKSYSPDV